MDLNKKIIFLIALIVILTFFTLTVFSEIFSTFEWVDDVENSNQIKKVKSIPEVEIFLSKHVDTSRRIGLETSPISIQIHASGGYTGEILIIYTIFDFPISLTYKCWSDSGEIRLFSESIIQHIENNSCSGM